MRNIDASFPVFVLMGLLVGETYYAKTLVPRIKQFKRQHGVGAELCLHSRDIRRREGLFKFLRDDAARREAFLDGIGTLFTTSRIRLYAVAIDKHRLLERSLLPLNPYDVSLSQLLSVICGPPRAVGSSRPKVGRIIAESRGKREDKELQREYQSLRRLGFATYGATDVQQRRPETVQRLYPDRIDFLRKERAAAGLELADLAAYPIARAVVSQHWASPSVRVVQAKLRQLVLFP
jgi:hypothetical protein